MNKLKTALEEKDYLKAKRLIIDNPEYLEENVDFILGIVKEYNELFTISERVDKRQSLMFEIMNKEVVPVYHDLMDQLENYKQPPDDEVKPLFRKATLESLKKMFDTPNVKIDNVIKKVISKSKPLPDLTPNQNWSPSEAILSRPRHGKSEMFNREYLGDWNEPYKNKELAHEQAIMINEVNGGKIIFDYEKGEAYIVSRKPIIQVGKEKIVIDKTGDSPKLKIENHWEDSETDKTFGVPLEEEACIIAKSGNGPKFNVIKTKSWGGFKSAMSSDKKDQ